jgi:hypothetical protein
MSETTFYAILFFGFFPALWLFAWVLDRIWPTTSEILKARGESLKEPPSRERL